MGRPPHQPESSQRRQVEGMAGCGISEDDIARVLGIDAEILREHYREELETGQVTAATRVAESLFRTAIGDDNQAVRAAIFWLKTRARWKERSPTDEANTIQVVGRLASPKDEARQRPLLPKD